ncbi:MAG: 2-hydroxyacyl-CoA dehydratase [Deltaproteobacteria bacterium]|nr:2-hydroxyacyl-CoA dehydratase [Deltaproteobacteria bacterium]
MENLISKIDALKKDGKKIIGAFPLYPPLELFHSMGLIPVVLWGLKKHFPTVTNADKHIQSYACSIARHLAEFTLSEAGAMMDGLYIYNACDTLRNMPELLTCGIKEVGRELPLFRMHIPMTSPELTDTQDYLKNEVKFLIQRLEETYNKSFSGIKFKQSTKLYGIQRRLAKEAEKKVAEGRISFVDYLKASEENLYLPVEKQIDALEKLLLSNTKKQEQINGNFVVLSGIIPPHESIIETIEEAGLRIVANDIASLYRSIAVSPEETESAEEYYARFYAQHFPCTTLLPSANTRITALKNLLSDSNADGMIFIGEKFCEHEYFEFPYLEKQFREMDVKTLLLEFSIQDYDNIETYKTRIEAFAELLST